MTRRILAVLAGSALWALLWLGANLLSTLAFPDAYRADGSVASAWLLIVFLVLPVLFSLAAGATTARVAGARWRGPVWALALLQLAIGVFVQSQYWEVMPLWFHLPFLALLVPGVVVGGHLAQATGKDALEAT